jgi:hypothetical protein
MKRERRRDLPEGADFWDFDCRFGTTKDTAQPVPVTQLTPLLDALAMEGSAECYVELLVRPAVWQRRPADGSAADDHPAQSSDGPDTDPSAPSNPVS